MNKIVDYSPKTGVYEGNLAYGRTRNGNAEKHKDFSADRDENGLAKNPPIVGLVLVQPRDPEVWTKDNRVKEIKKQLDNSQNGVNYLLTHLKGNAYFRIKVGKQRF